MCGRYTATSPLDALAQLLDAELVLSGNATASLAPPRFNVAPTQPVAAVRHSHSRGRRILVALRWGLIPSWAEDPAIGARLINARSESVFQKPAFRAAIRRRRCVIPADGFYEWQRQAPRGKQPFYLRRTDGEPMLFAGIWERWRPADSDAADDGSFIDSCAILTTGANAVVAPLHDRMPLILEAHQVATWLDPEVQEPDALRPLLERAPTLALEAVPVSLWVNDPSHDDPRCIEAQPGAQLDLL